MRRKGNVYRQIILLCFVLVEIILVSRLVNEKQPEQKSAKLNAYTWESDSFRKMDFGEGTIEQAVEQAKKRNVDVYSLIAARFTRDDRSLPNERQYAEIEAYYRKESPVEWNKLVNAYRTVLADLRYFPVALPEGGFDGLAYENGWGDSRTYGGDRLHEGTDICDKENRRGSYPIVSMTDGVIEHVGWLEQGGYRIGIRAPHGAYFYYAHLASYAKEFTVGERVSAGQILGMMGDTGYSKIEGTTGNFVVHLHLGIYIRTDHYEELSVNPYYMLKYLEKSTITYTKDSYLWYTKTR